MGKKKSASGEELLELTWLLFTNSQGMAPQACPLLYPAHGGLAMILNILTFKISPPFSFFLKQQLPATQGRKNYPMEQQLL